MGVAAPPAGKSYFQISLPDSSSNARIALSIVAAENTTPPAVTIGPPRVTVPVFIPGTKLPSGTSHAFFPVNKSPAATVPHGGGLHKGKVSVGPINGGRNIAYGVPACRPHSPCKRS